MVSEKVVITSTLGIHLRPAGAISEAATKYESHISVKCDQKNTANGKSLISLLAAGIKCGDEVLVVAEGSDEEEALKAVVSALKQSLEDDETK